MIQKSWLAQKQDGRTHAKEDFETAIYPVEPHGFVQPSSWLDEYRRIYKLFEDNL